MSPSGLAARPVDQNSKQNIGDRRPDGRKFHKLAPLSRQWRPDNPGKAYGRVRRNWRKLGEEVCPAGNPSAALPGGATLRNGARVRQTMATYPIAECSPACCSDDESPANRLRRPRDNYLAYHLAQRLVAQYLENGRS
jgi:hypothetical protein